MAGGRQGRWLVSCRLRVGGDDITDIPSVLSRMSVALSLKSHEVAAHHVVAVALMSGKHPPLSLPCLILGRPYYTTRVCAPLIAEYR
jgi:hypothetical protein